MHQNCTKNQIKSGSQNACEPAFILARPVGLEPTTYGLEGRCSIQLSYERICYAFSAGGL